MIHYHVMEIIVRSMDNEEIMKKTIKLKKEKQQNNSVDTPKP